MSHHNDKKNDSFPQKNGSLNATQLPREALKQASGGESDVVFEEEKSTFVFFNKTSLIGVAVLAIALISVAIPYSLGWFSPSALVAESTDPEAGELSGEQKQEKEPSPALVSPLVNNSQKYAADQVDDDLATGFGFDDINTLDSALDSSLLPGETLADFQADHQAESQREPEKQEVQMIGTVPGEEDAFEIGLSDIPGLEEDFEEPEPVLAQHQPERVLSQPPLNREPKLTAPQRNERVVPTNPRISQEILDHNSQTDTLIDQAAITASSPAETMVNSALPKNTLRVAKHDSRPATTHPIDENDNLFPESDGDLIVQTNDDAQSYTETADATDARVALQNMEHPAVLRKEYRPKYAKMTQGSRAMPNTHGQLWCEYDITPFTKAPGIVPGSLPEQTIVKWVRHQTGEESWHGEPFGLISANTDTLYVYHTPETQEVVAEIVDRFVNPKGETDAYMFRIASLNGPNWLTPFHANLKPIRIDTPGAQGWLVAKEDYVKMVSELARRSDYKELCSPQFAIQNGRQYVVSSSIPKNYTPNVSPQNDVWPGYASEMAVINEGYSMTLIPLSGVDGVSADLMVKCDSMQVEKMHTVALNVPSQVTSRQRVTVESPQVAHFHLDEQIRWPKEKVLILSLGTIPVPSAAQYNDSGKLIPAISRTISGSPAARGHVLLFVECKKQ